MSLFGNTNMAVKTSWHVEMLYSTLNPRLSLLREAKETEPGIEVALCSRSQLSESCLNSRKVSDCYF